MNTLQLVNSVLRRLRKEEVTDFTDAYVKLILDFVNETKTEVEDAWNWSMLRQYAAVTTTAGVSDYSITGAGQRYRFLPNEDGTNVFAYDSTNRVPLYLQKGGYVNKQQYLQTTQSNIATDFSVIGQDSNLDPTIRLFNTPAGTYNLVFGLVVPQDDLSSISTELKVPWYPVVLGAWAKAISERGEDGGRNTSDQWAMYNKSLSDAVQLDVARLGDEIVWQPI